MKVHPSTFACSVRVFWRGGSGLYVLMTTGNFVTNYLIGDSIFCYYSCFQSKFLKNAWSLTYCQPFAPNLVFSLNFNRLYIKSFNSGLKLGFFQGILLSAYKQTAWKRALVIC
jgi:hypothetical protein